MRRYGLLALLIVGLPLVLVACAGDTTVVFNNQSECGTIRIELTNSQTGATEYHDVPVDGSITVTISPNITYLYAVDYTVGDGPAVCTEIRRGEVAVPSGATQHFNLIAVTPTPGGP